MSDLTRLEKLAIAAYAAARMRSSKSRPVKTYNPATGKVNGATTLLAFQKGVLAAEEIEFDVQESIECVACKGRCTPAKKAARLCTRCRKAANKLDVDETRDRARTMAIELGDADPEGFAEMVVDEKRKRTTA